MQEMKLSKHILVPNEIASELINFWYKWSPMLCLDEEEEGFEMDIIQLVNFYYTQGEKTYEISSKF